MTAITSPRPTARRRRALRAALATCVLAALAAVVTPAAAAASWSDPAGDAAAGVPDVQRVTVTPGGDLLRWTLEAAGAPPVSADVLVDVVIHGAGSDHWLRVDGEKRTITHYLWDATTRTWSAAAAGRLEANDAFPLGVAIDRATLGDPAQVTFFVETWHHDATATPAWRSDRAPATGAWQLELGSSGGTSPAPGTTPPSGGGTTGPVAGPTDPAATLPVAPAAPGAPQAPGAPSAPGGAPAGPPGTPAVPPGVPAGAPVTAGAGPGPAGERVRVRSEAVQRRGDLLTVRLGLVRGTRRVSDGVVSCKVRAAGRGVRVLAAGFVRGQARCRFRLTRTRSAVVTVRVMTPSGTVTHTVHVFR